MFSSAFHPAVIPGLLSPYCNVLCGSYVWYNINVPILHRAVFCVFFSLKSMLHQIIYHLPMPIYVRPASFLYKILFIYVGHGSVSCHIYVYYIYIYINIHIYILSNAVFCLFNRYLAIRSNISTYLNIFGHIFKYLNICQNIWTYVKYLDVCLNWFKYMFNYF